MIHKKIYLQVESDEITWCQDKINDEDIEYILLSEVEKILAELYNTPAYYEVAKLCDEKLDRSGALLGRVRYRASVIKGVIT